MKNRAVIVYGNYFEDFLAKQSQKEQIKILQDELNNNKNIENNCQKCNDTYFTYDYQEIYYNNQTLYFDHYL